jgi:hypothetical protein
MQDWLPASALGLTGKKGMPQPPLIGSGSSTVSPPATRQASRHPVGASRRSASPLLWACGISAALGLVAAGVLIGYLVASRSGSDTAGLGTVTPNADPRAARPASPATPARSAKATSDGPGGSSSASERIAAASPFRTSPGDATGLDAAPPGGPLPTTQGTPMSDGRPSILYQEVDLHRRPSFKLVIKSLTQDIHYKIYSQLKLEPRSEDGSFRVTQQVFNTELVRADAMSSGRYQEELRKLIGRQFHYTLNQVGEVTRFDGYEDKYAAVPIEMAGLSGLQMTSVLDKDGWKEIIQLSFLEPARHIAPGQYWQRQMAHEFPPLGRWEGTTTFTQEKSDSPPLLQYSYVHDMKFHSAGGSADMGGLPISLGELEFELKEAQGRFVYDPAKLHVTQVDEVFHINASLGGDLLGGMGSVSIEERQELKIRLSTQNTW